MPEGDYIRFGSNLTFPSLAHDFNTKSLAECTTLKGCGTWMEDIVQQREDFEDGT